MYIILLNFLNIMLSYVLYNYFFVEKIILRIYIYEIETTSIELLEAEEIEQT